MLHDNTLLRRAAVELVCNLCPFPNGAAKFADGSTRAKGRLRVLLAMADVEDLPTRRAAAGGLAMLTEFEAVAKEVLAIERGVGVVLGLVGDEDQGVLHRGLVVLGNLVLGEGEQGSRARELVRNQGGVDVAMVALRGTREEECLRVGVEVLKALKGDD